MATRTLPSVLNKWIQEAHEQSASDLFLTRTQNHIRVDLRVAGMQVPLDHSSSPENLRIPEALRHACGFPLQKSIVHWDGILEAPDAQPAIRVALLKTFSGETWSLRFHQTDRVYDDSGEKLANALLQPLQRREAKLHLIAGGTGDGKTTTLYSVLRSLSSRIGKILTIEDPIEQRVDEWTQSEVNTESGWNTSMAIRAFLRQDPDLIVVGEIRDHETAHATVRAALSGHPVLATLHAGGIDQIPSRLNSLGIADWQQRAVRGLHYHQKLEPAPCPSCESGCHNCQFTGFSGRKVRGRLCTVF